MKFTSDKENEIISACIDGKRLYQKVLYEHFSSKMFAVCLRYAGDRAQAEDIMQDGFVKVFRNLAKFRHEGSFEGWLRRIFVNTAIEHFRKKVHNLSIDEYGNQPELSDEVNVQNHLQAQDLMAMVQELSPGYRLVFNMYAIEGYSHKEIAKELGISEGTSKSQLSRARQILQEKIMEYDKKNSNL